MACNVSNVNWLVPKYLDVKTTCELRNSRKKSSGGAACAVHEASSFMLCKDGINSSRDEASRREIPKKIVREENNIHIYLCFHV